ncbi:MAG: PstS family phosphate ABC transporter substrate-binding protein [Nitrospiraceae bacterium]|jgi:phosphate transport system substrate-binding protein|nr:PstS family phosphate ABC transporter substrate-binding protein [Nitrospiraceae bacterium]
MVVGSILALFATVSLVQAEVSTIHAIPVVDSGIASYVPKTGISGGIAIAGSDTMQPIIAKIASAFRQWQPNIKLAVQGGGSDAAMIAFVQNIAASRRGDGNVRGHLSSNDVTILASSRPLTEAERQTFHSRYGFEPTEVPIALDAVAIYVNYQNPLEGLTLDQLDAIFSKTRKRGAAAAITTWGQLGLQEGWEQQPIRLYGRDKRSGTRTFFLHTALLNGELNPDLREAPGTAMEILDLSRDAAGIGYAGIGFQASTVRILPIAEKAGAPFVLPTAESATNGSYPLARPLYLYAKRSPKGELDADVAEFLKFVNSREGQETIAKAGVFPLSASQVTTNLQALIGAPMSASTLTASTR